MSKKMIMLSIIMLFWLASIEPVIDAIFHIADYGDIVPVLINKSTIVYLGLIIYAIYFNKYKLINWLSIVIAPVLCFFWTYFFAWDISDFIKHPNFGYWIFLLSPPILSLYCMYWIIYCLMTICGKNKKVNCII